MINRDMDLYICEKTIHIETLKFDLLVGIYEAKSNINRLDNSGMIIESTNDVLVAKIGRKFREMGEMIAEFFAKIIAKINDHILMFKVRKVYDEYNTAVKNNPELKSATIKIVDIHKYVIMAERVGKTAISALNDIENAGEDVMENLKILEKRIRSFDETINMKVSEFISTIRSGYWVKRVRILEDHVKDISYKYRYKLIKLSNQLDESSVAKLSAVVNRMNKIYMFITNKMMSEYYHGYSEVSRIIQSSEQD